MDFWNRLIGGSSSAGSFPQKVPQAPATPEERLEKFKRHWKTLLHSWRNARESDPSSHDLLRSHLKRLNDLLIDEEKRVPGPSSRRLCINFCYTQEVFIAISKIGQTPPPSSFHPMSSHSTHSTGSISNGKGVILETIRAFSMFVESEDEDFIGRESFAQSLIAFLEAANRNGVSRMVEGEFVELLFSIAAKIRMSKGGNLRVWVRAGRGDGEEEDASGGAEELHSLEPGKRWMGMSNKEEFPLFYLLIDYVHHEGRVGDFARTGLLYLVEATSSSKDLEGWLVQSDLSTLMASGLGALYSQLSRKLVMAHPPTKDPPTILAISDFTPKPPAFEAVTSSSPEFQVHLETFLSYLVFWQDVLEHCRSAEVKQTLLAHFQVLFLQQLLYPSLLESSDIDGGSSVAVLTYVRAMLDTLDHAEMIHLILSFLMNLPEKPLEDLSPKLKAKRRQSIDMLSKSALVEDNPTPAIYSLADLILNSLGSKNQQTTAATLRLTSTILRKHYPYAVGTLLKTTPLSSTAPSRTIGAYNAEIDLLFSFVTDISEENSAAETYEGHLRDVLMLLESHPCSARLLGLKPSVSAPQPELSINDPMSRMHIHTITAADPLLKGLLDLLASFFANPVEINLVLTAAIIDLAACAWMRPEGWLYFDPKYYTYPQLPVAKPSLNTDLDPSSDNEADDDSSDDDLSDLDSELAAILSGATSTNSTTSSADPFSTKSALRQSALTDSRRRPLLDTNYPPVLATVKALVKQVATFRGSIPDFDERLKEHRRSFEVQEGVAEAVNTATSTPTGSVVGGSTPRKLDPFNPRSLVSRASRHTISTPSPVPATARRVGLERLLNVHVPPVIIATAEPRDTTRDRGMSLGTHLPPPPEGEEDEEDEDEGGEGDGEGERRRREEEERRRREDEERREKEERTRPIGLVLTNVMVLQEFVLELAALTQARGSLFGDIKYA